MGMSHVSEPAEILRIDAQHHLWHYAPEELAGCRANSLRCGVSTCWTTFWLSHAARV